MRVEVQKKKITDRLPKPLGEHRFVQARIDVQLFERSKQKMKLNGYTWDQVIDACLRTFCEE